MHDLDTLQDLEVYFLDPANLQCEHNCKYFLDPANLQCEHNCKYFTGP